MTTDIRDLIDSKQGGIYIAQTKTQPIPEVKEILPELLANDPVKFASTVNYLKSKRK